MSSAGIGVMLRKLDAYKASQGKTITGVALVDDKLHIAFLDGSTLVIQDKGQSCCESRYMRTDDDLAKFVGAKFVGAELRDAPDQKDEHGEVHEVQFLIVNTTVGAFTMASHVEHNGYYGGFLIECSVIAGDSC